MWPVNELYCTGEEQNSLSREEEMKRWNNVTKYRTDQCFYSGIVGKLELLCFCAVMFPVWGQEEEPSRYLCQSVWLPLTILNCSLSFFFFLLFPPFLSQIQKLIYALQRKGRQRLHCFTLSYVYKSNEFLTFYSYRYSCSSYAVTKAEIIK